MKSQAIAGSTRLVGLLGDPVAHSLSPAIHNHVYATLGLPLAYVPLPAPREHLHAAVIGMRACGFAGANVTIPHKQAVLPYCDVLSSLSNLTGTVNTLYFRNNLLHGTTTDWDGFRRALAFLGHDPAAGGVVILGNGGAARTLAFGFASEKIPARLTLVGRDAGRVATLAAEVSRATGFPVASARFSSDGLARVMKECTLCVNCTSVGMHPDTNSSPLDKQFLHTGLTVFDTIYNPGKTLLCRQAQEAGCAWSGGLRMLVFQALASIAFWTGRDIAGDIIDFSELERLLETPSLPEDSRS